MNYQDREKLALNVRANILKMTNQAASGHPGGSLSAVELLITLYFHEMNINEENVDHVHRDKFCTHILNHKWPLFISFFTFL